MVIKSCFNLWLKLLLWVLVCSFYFKPVFAEPSYCEPKIFNDFEVSLAEFSKGKKNTLVKAHAFKLGKTTLVGAGVGDSEFESLVHLSKLFSKNATDKEKYCTWYLNHPKLDSPYDQSNAIRASLNFNHKDIVKSPSLMRKMRLFNSLFKL